MFDRPIHISPPDVKVTINQQPVDAVDAARLYGELVHKAEREVSSATLYRFGPNNSLTVVKVMTDRSYASREAACRVLYRLNGRDYDLKVVAIESIEEELCETVANLVAAKVYEQISGKTKSLG